MSKNIWHFLVFLIIGFNSYATVLKTGDIILQPLSCHTCWLIQKEENGPYSHMGLVVEQAGELFVAESRDKVSLIPIKQFLDRPTLSRKHLVIRHRELENLSQSAFSAFEWELMWSFYSNFLDHGYNSSFLWNSSNSQGKRLYYCSEMVTELLNPFLVSKIQTKKMHFNCNRKFWSKYFHGKIPDGAPGNSPMDFYRSKDFRNLGEIDNEANFLN